MTPEYVRSVATEAGSVDVSFNLISRGDVQGIPYVDMTAADFLRPITTGVTAHFITARAAARQMIEQGSIEQGSGVILSGPAG